jgi:acyl-CoA reductase-like NAD-dependent aldehyde dehydrogenase
MDMLIGGKWAPAASGSRAEITSPFDGAVAGTVPVAGPSDVDAALTAAQAGAATWRRTPAHERMRILLRAAELADERALEIARLISTENGKAITEAAGEAGRSGDIIRLSAFEGAHLYGDSLPPYGGLKGSGIGKEGPRSAVAEMTESKTVVLHGQPW